MDNEDIIVSGGLGDEDIDEVEDFEEDAADAAEQEDTPALRRLYAAHPECLPDYIETVLTKVPITAAPPRTVSAADAAAESLKEAGDKAPNFDANHKTYPFLTKYESARIVGFRANQLSQGAQPFISVPEHVTDVREIARMELAAKRLPFIVKRPLPDGTYEYWRLQDLLQI